MQRIHYKGKKQSGFTIIELIVVIVILGILAAVAIPKFNDSTQDARAAVEQATLGALKSAWSAAYAANKGAPSLDQLLAQMADPTCTVTESPKFTCTKVYQKASSANLAVFKVTSAASVASPADISFDTE